MKFRIILALFAGLCIPILMAVHINTAARCASGSACEIGDTNTASMQLLTDGASFGVDVTGNTATLTATTTATAVYTGADAAGAANTTYDTTGAGAIQVGSADVTANTIVSDGGTATVDGYVQADVGPIVSLASGALTANTVHLATAAADYVLPACETANIGEWVTVIVQDISEVVVLQPASGDTINPAGAVIDVDHEMDSSGAATGDGDFVTLVCVVADMWFSTAIGGAWVDGGAS